MLQRLVLDLSLLNLTSLIPPHLSVDWAVSRRCVRNWHFCVLVQAVEASRQQRPRTVASRHLFKLLGA